MVILRMITDEDAVDWWWSGGWSFIMMIWWMVLMHKMIITQNGYMLYIWWHDNRFEVNWPPEPTLVLRWISKFFLFGALPSDTLKIKHTKILKEIPSRHVLENRTMGVGPRLARGSFIYSYDKHCLKDQLEAEWDRNIGGCLVSYHSNIKWERSK